jgi:dTDP-4-dehydrorhamnose 3,5-epimerase
MKFTELGLRGASLIEMEPVHDERGFVARCWNREEFAAHGLLEDLPECNLSFNKQRGTLRGLHYQAAPFEQAKLVRCAQGSIYDVIVDLRSGSPTHGRWEALEITTENHRMVYVPKGFAHGFMTLSDSTEVAYQMSGNYTPTHARGIRWDDPSLAVTWPIAPTTISTRDRSYPLMEASWKT